MIRLEHDPTENLRSLHRQEEDLRTQGLKFIESRTDLQDHYRLIAEAMNVIYAFSHDYHHAHDDELTLGLLGIRLFNAAGAALKLGLAGYYQKAFQQVRDVLETGFLVDYLRTNPEMVAQWKAADKKTRIDRFGPGPVRNALDKRDGFTSSERKRVYDTLSEAASHASYQGFSLLTNEQNLAAVGPFLDERKLAVVLFELATRLCHAAAHLVADHEGQDLRLLATRAHYLKALEAWRLKYLEIIDRAHR
jgi:hypothetical protein